MVSSTRSAALLSLGTQGITKLLNLGVSIFFVRLASAESVGLYTLLLGGSQVVCSLGRLGTNYSYAVTLPSERDSFKRTSLTVSYAFIGLVSSLVLSLAVVAQLVQLDIFEELGWVHKVVWICVVCLYFFSEGLAELFWSISLALERYRSVFIRDVWLAGIKGIFAITGALWMGPQGVVAGLSIVGIINSIVSIASLSDKASQLTLLTQRCKQLISLESIKLLLGKGLTFFSVPLISNLILWPFLLNIVSVEGVSTLNSVRIAQICAQLIAMITGSIIPVLLVKSSNQPDRVVGLHQKAFYGCWSIVLLVFGVYSMLDTTMLPLVFGSKINNATIQVSRMLVAGAALQGLSQIPLQRPFETKDLFRAAMVQVCSLILAGVVTIFGVSLGMSTLLSYGLINILSPLFTIVLLAKSLGVSFTPKDQNTLANTGGSVLYLFLCFAIVPNAAALLVQFAVALMILLYNVDFFRNLGVRIS